MSARLFSPVSPGRRGAILATLGKLLFFLGSQGHWNVVRDTFVVGCKFSEMIIYLERFENKPDLKDLTVYPTEYGLYKPNCGLDNALSSWRRDEVSREIIPP